jgi:hypothetical protein
MTPAAVLDREHRRAVKDREQTRRSAAAVKAARHNKEMYTDDGNEYHLFFDIENLFGPVRAAPGLRNIDQAFVALGVPTHRLQTVCGALLTSLRYVAPEAILPQLAVRVYQTLRSHVPDATAYVTLAQVRTELIRAGVEPNPGPQDPARVVLLHKEPGQVSDALSPREVAIVADHAGVSPAAVQEAVEGARPMPYVLSPEAAVAQAASARQADARWADYNAGSRKGPSKKSAEDKPMWKARKEACARQKTKEGVATSPKAIIGAQLTAEAQAKQGEDEATAARVAEEAAKEKLARAIRQEQVLTDHINSTFWKPADVRAEGGAVVNACGASELFWHACPDPKSAEATLCEVASSLDTLCRYPWPHVVLGARFLGADTMSPIEGEAIPVSPMKLDTPAAPGVYHVVRFEVTAYRYPTVGEPDTQKAGVVAFSWEQWCAAHERRIYRPSLAETLQGVTAYRAVRIGVPAPDLTYANAGVVSDQLFAALMCLEYERTQSATSMAMTGLKMIISSGLEKGILRRLIHDRGARPVAGGQYIYGYHTNFSDIWPKQWARAVDDVAAGADATERAGELIEEVTEHMSLERARPKGSGRELAARQSPVAVEGCHPAFPCSGACSELLSFLKRLSGRLPPADEEQPELEMAVADGIELSVSMRAEEPDTAHVLDLAVEKTKAMAGVSPQDREVFIAGAHDALEAIRGGAREVSTFIRREWENLTSFFVFRKVEALPNEEIKTARNIAAPAMRARGILFAIFSPCAHTLFGTFAGNCVKNKTIDQVDECLADATSTEAGASAFVTVDTSSFELVVTEARRRLEWKVLRASVKGTWQQAIDAVEKLMVGQLMFDGKFWNLVRPSMRASGEYNTSQGNWIVNTCIQFATIFKALGVPADRAAETFRSWRHSWMIEGDDTFFSIARDKLDQLRAAYATNGTKITFNWSPRLDVPGFVGRIPVNTRKGLRKICDVYSTVAKLTWWIDPDLASTRADWDLLVARAMAYGSLYPTTPVVGALCRRILRAHERVARRLIDEAEDPYPASVAARWLRKEFINHHGESDGERLAQLGSLFSSMGWCMVEYEPPEEEEREAVANAYPELTPAVQRRMEVEIEGADLSRPITFSFPQFQQIRARCRALREMSLEKYDDIRNRADQIAESVRTKAAAAGVAAGSWASAWCVFLTSLWGYLSAVMGVVSLAATVVWAIGGAIVTSSAWLMTFGFVVAPLIFAAPFMAAGVLFLVLWLIFGFSRVVSRRILNAVAWFVALSWLVHVLKRYPCSVEWWLAYSDGRLGEQAAKSAAAAVQPITEKVRSSLDRAGDRVRQAALHAAGHVLIRS